MEKRTVSATFSDGSTITRKTSRGYTHAFKASATIEGRVQSGTGFASSESLARKAADQVFNAGRDSGAPKWNVTIEIVAVR